MIGSNVRMVQNIAVEFDRQDDGSTAIIFNACYGSNKDYFFKISFERCSCKVV